MTPEQEAKLRAAFLKVRDEGPTCLTCGVCFNVYDLVRAETTLNPYRIVGKLAATWPELDLGAELDDKEGYNYPIRSTGNNRELWVGEQLRLRISLINHVLDHLDTYQE